MFLEIFFVPAILLVLLWFAARIVRRQMKRKAYGRRLLVVKDITSSMDLFFGIIFLIPALWLIRVLLINYSDILIIKFSWIIYLSIFSITNFVKAFSKVEIFEKGLLSKDDLWDWNKIKEYELKENEKTVTYNFKLDRKIFKSSIISISKSDKERVENAIDQAFQLIYE